MALPESSRPLATRFTPGRMALAVVAALTLALAGCAGQNGEQAGGPLNEPQGPGDQAVATEEDPGYNESTPGADPTTPAPRKKKTTGDDEPKSEDTTPARKPTTPAATRTTEAPRTNADRPRATTQAPQRPNRPRTQPPVTTGPPQPGRGEWPPTEEPSEDPTTEAPPETTPPPPESSAPPPPATTAPPGLDFGPDECSEGNDLPVHDGFQNGNRCVDTEMGELGEAGTNPSLLITDAPERVGLNEPFTIEVSTRNLVRDRFLPAGQGGYYVDMSILNAQGLVRGHFHTACRVLTSTDLAPEPAPVPAFFVATEDSRGSTEPDIIEIRVPGLAQPGTFQCAAWAGDASHRIPMMQRANQIPALDSVRVEVG